MFSLYPRTLPPFFFFFFVVSFLSLLLFPLVAEPLFIYPTE